jgi:hypothetical protein
MSIPVTSLFHYICILEYTAAACTGPVSDTNFFALGVCLPANTGGASVKYVAYAVGSLYAFGFNSYTDAACTQGLVYNAEYSGATACTTFTNPPSGQSAASQAVTYSPATPVLSSTQVAFA